MARKKDGSEAVSFTPEVTAKLCQYLSTMTITAACKKPGMPNKFTFSRWINKEGKQFDTFREAVKLAQIERAQHLADEAVAIADSLPDTATNPMVNAARLRVDTRKWYAARTDPRRWGDRVEHTGEVVNRYVAELPPQPKDTTEWLSSVSGDPSPAPKPH